MNNVILYIVWILSIVGPASTSAIAQRGSSSSDSPFSSVTRSENGRFEFVIISKANLDEYRSEAVRSWEKTGMEKSGIAKLRDSLEKDLKREQVLRRRYKANGIYEFLNSQYSLLTTLEMPPEIDRVFVSNDGRHVVGLNDHIARDMSNNPSAQDLLNTNQLAILILSSRGREPCQFKIRDLLSVNSDRISNGVHGFEWTKEELFMDNDSGVFSVTKLNGDVIRLRLEGCSFIKNTDLVGDSRRLPDKTGCYGTFVLALVSSTVIAVARR